MPMYHLDIKLEIDGAVVQFQQVIEAASSEPGMAEITIGRVLAKGESSAFGDHRIYTGNVHRQLDLIAGSVPTPEPITDRRGAIRDQKARNG